MRLPETRGAWMGLLFLVAGVAGCSPGWNALNRASLETDVGEVLARGLPNAPSIKCRMLGSTRSGYCTLELDRTGAVALADALGLGSGAVDLEDLTSIPPAAVEGGAGCLSSEVMGPVDGLPAYWITGRPDSLALHSGRQFEYLMLILNEETGQACVQVSYAYG